MTDNVLDLGDFREDRDGGRVHVGFGDADVVPEGLYRHADGTLSSEPESERGLWNRVKNAGASLRRYLPVQKTEASAAFKLEVGEKYELRDSSGMMISNITESSDPQFVSVEFIGFHGKGVVEYQGEPDEHGHYCFRGENRNFDIVEKIEQQLAKELTTSRLAGVSNFMKDMGSGFGEFFTNAKDAAASLLKKSEDKKPLLQRIRDVGSNLDALSTMGASIGVGVAAKFLIGGTAVATLGAAVAPIAVAIGVSTFVATGMKLRKEYNASIVEKKKQEAIAAYLTDEEKLGNPQTENPEDVLKFIHKNEYDPQANYGFLRKTGAAALDLFNLKMYAYAYKNKTLARALGYGLGAGLTSGVSAGLTTGVVAGLKHFAHDGFGLGGDNSSADAAVNTKPATFASAPIEQKLEMVRGSIQGEPSAYITNRLTEAAQGNAQAMKDVARALLAGEHGVPADQTRAIALYEQAAAAGNPQAIRDLAFIRSLPAVDQIEPAEVAEVPQAQIDQPSIQASQARVIPQTDIVPARPNILASASSADVNADLLPVEGPIPLRPTTIIGYNVAGFNPNGNSMAQCFNMSETCEAAQDRVAQGNELVRFQDGQVAVEVQMQPGERLSGFLGRQFARWSEIRGQLDTLGSRIRSGQSITPEDIGAGNRLTVAATGEQLAGRDALPTDMNVQFADASAANDNLVALNDNGTTAMDRARRFATRALGMK